MDIFSHALLPYLLGDISRRKKQDITAFVLGGIAPDFDIFIMWVSFIYPNFYLITHRGLTHSLFFGFFTGLAVLYLGSRCRIKTNVRRFIEFEPVISPGTVGFASAGVVLHLFLDYLTTRGVPLFYPFDFTRYSAEIFFYTDIYLTILSLGIIIALYKKILRENAGMKLLIVFLIIFAVLGTVRFDGKRGAEDFIQGSSVRVYPTMSPFNWYVLAEDGDKIKIYEYDGFDGKSIYNETILRTNIGSGGENLDAALGIAGELPQVKMLEWRAYTVAVNASFNGGKWLLEYYDPLQRAIMREYPAFFWRINSPVNVTVERGKAVIS